MTSREIVAEVAARWGLAPADLTGKSRRWYVSAARRDAMKRIRSELRMTYPAIGRVFNRKHTSVMYQVRKMEKEATT